MARITKGDYVTGGAGWEWKTPVKVLKVFRKDGSTWYTVVTPRGKQKTFSPAIASRIRKVEA